MSANFSSSKIGVFVDAANMYRNGGARMRYDVLREFACRDFSEPLRLNVYVAHDAIRAQEDETYREKALGFHSALRDCGYKVIIKEVRWFKDESGNRFAKANADLDLAVDALSQSERLDRVLIATGDGDFVQLVRALQNKGCRVEVMGLENVSSDLRQEADYFISGFLIPNLIPTEGSNVEWGNIGATIRGWCYYYNHEKGIGYMRFLSEISPGLWLTDSRKSYDSPYHTAFFHVSQMRDSGVTHYLPNREMIFEFTLVEPDRNDQMKAENIRLVCRL